MKIDRIILLKLKYYTENDVKNRFQLDESELN